MITTTGNSNGVNGVVTPPATTTQTAAAAGSNTVLGKDDFLQMLVAQLKNQDPLDPMDGTQFAAQLAQFSTVEQLTSLNTTATGLASSTTQTQLAQQEQLGASLIGKDVVTAGANLNVVDGEAARFTVDLGGAADKLHIDIIGSDGKTIVGSQDYTKVGTGEQTMTVDTSKIPAGNYTYQVTATDANAKAVTVTPYTIGHVGSVGFQNGAVVLGIDGVSAPVAVTDVVEIIPAAPAAPTTN